MDTHSKNDIKFYLPDFYFKYNLNMALLETINTNPEYFRENIEIGAVYGSFPGAIWNGGRLVSGVAFADNIKLTINKFNDLGVPIRFTFTNSLIEEKHLNDTYCNFIMKCADNGMNEVLVNSPILEEYLRNTYPNYKYVLSTTRCERNPDKVNEACGKYHLVVTDFRDNHNQSFLDKLLHKEKIELMIDEYCRPDCKLREEHYRSISQDQLNFEEFSSFKCPYHEHKLSERNANPAIIKVDELYNEYYNVGFRNFKIVGRSVPMINVIESYAIYLAKPEFKEEVRYQLTKLLRDNSVV